MVAHPAADDEYTLLSQWRQSLPQLQMQRGVEALLQRHLHDGNVGARVDQQKRHEDTMVQSTLTVDSGIESRIGQQIAHARRKFGCAGYRVSQSIRVLRKSVIVEQQVGLLGNVERRDGSLPMTGHDEHCFRPHAKRGIDPAKV